MSFTEDDVDAGLGLHTLEGNAHAAFQFNVYVDEKSV